MYPNPNIFMFLLLSNAAFSIFWTSWVPMFVSRTVGARVSSFPWAFARVALWWMFPLSSSAFVQCVSHLAHHLSHLMPDCHLSAFPSFPLSWSCEVQSTELRCFHWQSLANNAAGPEPFHWISMSFMRSLTFRLSMKTGNGFQNICAVLSLDQEKNLELIEDVCARLYLGHKSGSYC